MNVGLVGEKNNYLGVVVVDLLWPVSPPEGLKQIACVQRNQLTCRH